MSTPSPDERAAIRTAADALSAAVDALHAIPDPDRPAGAVPIDCALVVGYQHVDDDGDRIGFVEVFPRDGSAPSYITRGLLADGLKLLDQAEDLPQGE